MTARRVPIFSTIVVIAAVLTMIGLGIWQLQRKQEKEALIARYQAALATPEPTFSLPDSPEAAFRRIETYCDNPTPSEPVSGRNARGQSGWTHVVLCEIGGPDPALPDWQQAPDHVIKTAKLVIGWSRDTTPIIWDGGAVSGIVVPDKEMGGRIALDPPVAGLQPLAPPDPADLPNNHLAYAGQWFFFALTALVIYVLALRRRGR